MAQTSMACVLKDSNLRLVREELEFKSHPVEVTDVFRHFELVS